jgi:hypothetical protein
MANEQTTVPLFTSGEVLTASDMNISAGTGVPVFANTTTRDAGFGGAGEKVLAEGQLCYLSDSNIVQYYTGAAWATVGPTTSKIAQVVSTTLTSTFTTTSTSFTDVTGLTVSITPTLNTSKIFVVVSVSGSNDVGVTSGGFRLTRGATSIFAGDAAGSRTLGQQVEPQAADRMVTLGLSVLDSPATTSATTYAVQCINSGAGTFYVNRSKTDTNTAQYFRGASSITVMEVLA